MYHLFYYISLILISFQNKKPQFHAGTEAYNNNKHNTKAVHLYFLLAIIHMNIKPIVIFKMPFIIISML